MKKIRENYSFIPSYNPQKRKNLPMKSRPTQGQKTEKTALLQKIILPIIITIFLKGKSSERKATATNREQSAPVNRRGIIANHFVLFGEQPTHKSPGHFRVDQSTLTDDGGGARRANRGEGGREGRQSAWSEHGLKVPV